MLRLTRRQALASALIAAFSATRASAAYPDRPIRVVSPYAAGGVGENIMRLLAVSMEPRLGQKLIVAARPGAAGNLGTEEVARARPDGETILIAATNNFVINQFVMKMTFDPLTTLTPIAKAAEIPLVLFSNPKMPARTLREFIVYTKANPGKVSYGVPSLGTVNHLMMERLKQITGMDMTCIPYRGSPPAVLALMKNEVQIFPIGLAAVGTSFSEGKLTALAVATPERVPMLPNVPTIVESGFPGFVASNWFGIAAPANTPGSIVDTLAQLISEAQNSALVQERFAKLGMLVPSLSRQQFAASLQPQAEFWRETVERGKISIE
jgi:tripartite-type tricarboxylate transporter receptor subunit TctC